jgi:hypothetical protein
LFVFPECICRARALRKTLHDRKLFHHGNGLGAQGGSRTDDHDRIVRVELDYQPDNWLAWVV